MKILRVFYFYDLKCCVHFGVKNGVFLGRNAQIVTLSPKNNPIMLYTAGIEILNRFQITHFYLLYM